MLKQIWRQQVMIMQNILCKIWRTMKPLSVVKESEYYIDLIAKKLLYIKYKI